MAMKYLCGIAALTLTTGVATADVVDVVGGQTSVLLDTAMLESAANLTLNGVSDDVITPGNLGDDSVAFGINARDGDLPTTFSYDPADFLGTFSGTIEHTGTILFELPDESKIELGNFTIGFDAARVGDAASGFFVASTFGDVQAILFDVENPSDLQPGEEQLVIEGNLLVSPEFATFLLDQGLASSDLTGADVGDALVEANVPAPAAAALLAIGAAATTRRRR